MCSSMLLLWIEISIGLIPSTQKGNILYICVSCSCSLCLWFEYFHRQATKLVHAHISKTNFSSLNDSNITGQYVTGYITLLIIIIEMCSSILSTWFQFLFAALKKKMFCVSMLDLLVCFVYGKNALTKRKKGCLGHTKKSVKLQK
jgi:hypothetical protein